MYLHIGKDIVLDMKKIFERKQKDIVLKNKDILYILDYDSLKENRVFNNFIEKVDKKNIFDISENKPKSIIITKEDNTIKGYISNISSNTLGKRSFI